jgi:hypothetical protein
MSRGSAAGRRRLRKSHLSAAGLAAIAALAVFAGAAQADVTEVSGGAFGESVDVRLLNAVPVTSGPLPSVTLPSSGAQPAITASVLSASVPGLLSAGVLNASTEGRNLGTHDGFATSSASVADVNALAGRITATVIGSECTSNGDGSTGSSTLTNVNILGAPVNVNTPPNTVISLPGVGSVTINEQIRTDEAQSTSIVVRAIHVRLNGLLGSGDVIIAESRCGAKGPDVVPVAPIGLLGVTAMLGVGFAGMQWKKRRHNQSVAASTH